VAHDCHIAPVMLIAVGWEVELHENAGEVRTAMTATVVNCAYSTSEPVYGVAAKLSDETISALGIRS
jgi:hypothetical protein